MNTEKILKLADIIENQPDTELGDGGFNMSDTAHHCGAPACIAGHAVVMEHGVGSLENRSTGMPRYPIAVMKMAARILGLEEAQRQELFAPVTPTANYRRRDPRHSDYISAARAAKTLRRLAHTGRVDWHPD